MTVPALGTARSSTAVVARPSWFLRGGLAFVFLFAAASSFADPASFTHYVPVFIRDAVPPSVLLRFFAAYEVLLALALLTDRYTYVASLLAALTLVGIVLLNLDAFSILFRNVAIAGAALALAEQARSPKAAGRRRRGTRPVGGPVDDDARGPSAPGPRATGAGDRSEDTLRKDDRTRLVSAKPRSESPEAQPQSGARRSGDECVEVVDGVDGVEESLAHGPILHEGCGLERDGREGRAGTAGPDAEDQPGGAGEGLVDGHVETSTRSWWPLSFTTDHD